MSAENCVDSRGSYRRKTTRATFKSLLYPPARFYGGWHPKCGTSICPPPSPELLLRRFYTSEFLFKVIILPSPSRFQDTRNKVSQGRDFWLDNLDSRYFCVPGVSQEKQKVHTEEFEQYPNSWCGRWCKHPLSLFLSLQTPQAPTVLSTNILGCFPHRVWTVIDVISQMAKIAAVMQTLQVNLGFYWTAKWITLTLLLYWCKSL